MLATQGFPVPEQPVSTHQLHPRRQETQVRDEEKGSGRPWAAGEEQTQDHHQTCGATLEEVGKSTSCMAYLKKKLQKLMVSHGFPIQNHGL